jgi:hypothetical protein
MRKLLLLAPVLLLASCHSTHVALQPKSAAAEPITVTTPTLPFDSTKTATVVATRPASASAPTPLPATQPLPPVGRSQRTSVLRPIARLATAANIATPVAKRLAHHLQRQRPTEGVAENGLGGVALFFIGVVLAVLAGLAALVNLIFSVGFFTALGYTAAGLVVLFLLYSLFSKGKKKKQ